MKNLFAIPRLSLPETFTILITLVVCLVGFANAEVYSNHRKRNPNQREKENFLLQKSSFRESVPRDSHEKSKISNELQQKKFASLRNLHESHADKLFKTRSDYFGESEDPDSEKESDGYGYDDDEYYHFNFKRNDDVHGSNENVKSEKEDTMEANAKVALNNDDLIHNPHKEGDKENEKIEMLNFKEYHTGNKNPNTKPLSEETHKKQFSADAGSSLKMSDLRENSAADEKVKEKKDTGRGSAANQKLADNKTDLKSESKDSAKLKDVKLTEDSQKRGKEFGLKDVKEAVAAKSLKEASNTSEGKEKAVKLNENVKLEENVNKMDSKSKEPAKIVKGEEETSNYSDKLNEDDLSEINSRANFASNDYKESVETLKTAGADEEEKNSYEVGGVDKTDDLDNCQEVKPSPERMRKQDKIREGCAGERLKAFNRKDAKESEAFRDEDGFLRRSSNYGTSNLNPKDIFKESRFWREGGLRDAKSRHQQNTLQQKTESDQNSQEPQESQDLFGQMMPQEQMQNQPTQNSILDSVVKNPFGLNIADLDSGNSDFRKGYTKSFKRLKGFGEKSKSLFPESSSTNSLVKNSHDRLEGFIKEPRETKNRRSTSPSVISEGKGKIHNKYSNNKRNVQDNQGSQSMKCQAHPREFEQVSSIKNSKGESTPLDGQNQDDQEDGSRLRRKSPQKFEYEIKVINQNKDDTRGTDELSHNGLKRVEKDLKSRMTVHDKYSKKYPYSQASRDDLMTLNKMTESEKYIKVKRRAPVVKRHDDKSNVQPRAAPSGYYGNRVKFGQKSLARSNERINGEHTQLEGNDALIPYLNAVDKSVGQRSREIKDDDFKHDPMKRFDESGAQNKGNSLLLVKKDERTSKAFEQGAAPTPGESDYRSDLLAKILAKDSDFLVLKRTEDNRFQKISENANVPNNPDDTTINQLLRGSSFGEDDDQKNNAKQSLLKKELQTRSFHFEKDDKKYASNLHGSKSNLKKTFDKFRDLAGFFKENEQEPVREVKEGRDVVFSEDKLPDPIVISSDPGEKYSAFTAKPLNSIYSISTNFKASDQQDKKKELHNFDGHNTLFASLGKPDNSEYSWEPALKSMFPEAKSINATIRNGNEVIVLDLNRNQLRREPFLHPLFKPNIKQPYAPFGSTAQLPVTNPQAPPNVQFPTSNQFYMPSQYPGNLVLPNGSRKVQMVLEEGNSVQQDTDNSRPADKSNKAHDRKSYTVFTSGDNDAKIIVPSSDASSFSSLIRNIFDKKDSSKAVSKKSLDGSPENKVTEHYNKFLKDLGELSEVKEKESKRQEYLDRRNPSGEKLTFNIIKQLPRDEVKYLGNLLQSIITNSDSHLGDYSDQGSLQHIEDPSSVDSKEDPDGITRHRSPGDEKSGAVSSIADRNDEYVSKEEGSAGLRSEMSIPTKEKNSEDEFWEELAAASDKIHRLRREGEEKRKRKAVERAPSHGERQQPALQNALPDWKSEEGGLSVLDSSFLDSKETEGARDENGNDSNWVAKLKGEEVSKGNSDLKTRFESHLKELIEGLGENKKQKEQLFVPNESASSRKKRKDTRRRKRSTWSDVKNKVSTTAVQNKILKNLAEDNYHNVYSPGIKRRLLSTDIEAEDADSYSDENERDKNVIAEEPQTKCVKNSLNECVDPMIIELLKDDAEEGKDRARRSLTSDFHSDFKREIDLDESMPNDFQNFLVTSLGAFGSQKREVVKKDEAVGEEKESHPDNNNRAVESGKEATEDSALEKREVSPDDNQKLSGDEKCSKSDSLADSNLAPLEKVESESENSQRVKEQSSLKSKTPELTEEKLPTQIRIQITNANRKEKKSFKPTAEESETTSIEVENFPNEREFLDSSKLNSLRRNNPSKFHHYSPSKFNYNEFDDGEDQDNGVKQVPYHVSRRRQKKKKLISDTPSIPANDLKLDQQAMESFPRKIMAETNLMADHTTQKSAVSNHLPQVETVYNPTQGTNKAQLESARFTKTNSIINKKSETARSNLDQPERSRIEEGFLRSYLKEKAENLESEKLRDFEECKSPNSVIGLRRKVDFNVKYSNGENPSGSSVDTTPFYSSSKQKIYIQKHPVSMNNYFLHPFSKESISPNNLYDALKLRKEMKNRNAANKDRQNSKILQKTYYMSDTMKQEDKGKSQNSPSTVGSTNSLDFTENKKFFSQGHNSGEYLHPAPQPQSERNNKNKMIPLKKYEAEEKYALLDASQGLPTDVSKKQDYPDGLEGDCVQEDKEEQVANDEQDTKNVLKETNKILQTPVYRGMFNYKLPDIDDGISEDDEEAEEEYEENAEDELDDYKPLAQKAMDPPEEGRFRSAIQGNPLSAFDFLNRKDNLQEVKGEFASPNTEAKFRSKSQLRDTAGRDSEPLCRTSSLLKKVNENSNIFGKNLMQNLYGPGYEELMPGFDQMLKHEMERANEILTKRTKLRERKLDSHLKEKRNRKSPEIGSRVHFGAKTETDDSDVLNPPSSLEKIKPLRSNNYRLTKEHFLDAEFAGPGNDYENESEEKGKYFNQINFAKNGFLQKVSSERNADEEGNETEDVKENPEDHGETISDDNILENVIGKYIMRKTVKASTDQASKRSTNKEKSHEKRSLWHKRRKRSADYPERVPKAKVVRRRLSAGHLTENNFRKFHKKNLTRKRHISGLESVPQSAGFPDQSFFKSENEEKIEIQAKRSALDLLKKLTNKDREKKAEMPIDSRTAGFEPLSPLNDEKLQGSANSKERTENQEGKLTSNLVQGQPKNSLVEPKLPFMSVGYISKEPSISKKKSKVTLNEGATQRMQGPWKIELNDKCDPQIADRPLKDSKKGFNNLMDMKLPPSREEPKGLKAFLVIGKNQRSVAVEEPLLPASGPDLKEVGSSSYRPNFEEGRGISNKYFRKRYLKSSVDRMKSGFGGGEKTSSKLTEKAENGKAEETSGALHETNSFAEGGSSQPTQGLQRNSKMSFVSADDQSKTSRFLSKGRLVKRKSSFPPSNDAKIIRESRHVNEETSEYLGQQVVNAILSHVGANPRFKEVIAPGLAPRTPTYKEQNYDKDSTLQQADVSNQLQYFLQRFMYDLEKLGERRVKKRMCSQIDEQSKQFLEFLLAAPTDNGKGAGADVNMCPIPAILPTVNDDYNQQKNYYYNGPAPECTPESETKTQSPVETTPPTTRTPMPKSAQECTEEQRTKPTTTECTLECRTKTPSLPETSYRGLKAEINSLRKKCCLLLKLIVDYQNLSKLEKEMLDAKYHSIMLQLDRINKEIKASKNCQEECPENGILSDEEFLCCGYKVGKNLQSKNFTQIPSNFFQTTESTRRTTIGRNKKLKQNQMKKLPKLYFEEMKNPAEPEVSTTKCIPLFENVSAGKLSELRKNSEGKSHATYEVAPATPAPHSFDLLLYSNSSRTPDYSKPTIITTTTCEPSIPKPICTPTPCPQALPTGDGQSVIINSISTANSGSDVRPDYVDPQEAGKERKKIASQVPRLRKKRSIRKKENEFRKSEGSRKRAEDNYEEYNWLSSVPAARQILNSLESGFEFDDVLLQKPKITKKWRRGEKKPD